MSDHPRKTDGMSRRRFVTLVAAGSAALIASPAAGAAPARRRPAAAPVAAGTRSAAAEKEFARQRAGTLGALKTIRGHAMPPGTELGLVFRPVRSSRKER